MTHIVVGAIHAIAVDTDTLTVKMIAMRRIDAGKQVQSIKEDGNKIHGRDYQ